MEIIKVIVDGRGGTGKSTMLQSLIKGNFIDNTRITIGVNFFTKDYFLLEHEVRAQFWDLGGVCRFDFLRSNYYKGAHSCVLVGDLTRPNTFEELNYFISLAREVNLTSDQIILVANKTDLFDCRIVDPDYLRLIMEKYHLECLIETSARFRDNLEIVFELAILIGLRTKGKITEEEYQDHREFLERRIQSVHDELYNTRKIIRKCWNCSRPLYFSEFSSTNASLSKERLVELWENPHLEFYCCNCFKNLESQSE